MYRKELTEEEAYKKAIEILKRKENDMKNAKFSVEKWKSFIIENFAEFKEGQIVGLTCCDPKLKGKTGFVERIYIEDYCIKYFVITIV